MHLSVEGSGEPPVSRKLEHQSQSLSLSFSSPHITTAEGIIASTASTISERLHSFLEPSAPSSEAPIDTPATPKSQILRHEVRAGAGSAILGYVKSSSTTSLQSIIAYTPALRHLRSVLRSVQSQVASGSNVALALHLIAQDYDVRTSTVVNNDYCSTLALVNELGFALVSSQSPQEAQHMTIFASALAELIPTIHIIDGLSSSSSNTVRDQLQDGSSGKLYASLRDVAKTQTVGQGQIEYTRQILRSFNAQLDTQYSAFECHGHQNPDVVLVVFGSIESSLASQTAQRFEAAGLKIAAINVRMYRPFDEEMFVRMLPASVTTVAVLGQVHGQKAVKDKSSHSALYQDVLSAIQYRRDSTSPLKVVDIKYPRSYQWSVDYFRAIFHQLLASHSPSYQNQELAKDKSVTGSLESADLIETSIWDSDRSPAIHARSTEDLLRLLATKDSSSNMSVAHYRDILTHGGITRIDIRQSSQEFSLPCQVRNASFTVVADVALLKHYDIARTLRKHSRLLIRIPSFKPEEANKHFSPTTRKVLHHKGVHIFIFNPASIKDLTETPGLEQTLFEKVIQAVKVEANTEPIDDQVTKSLSRFDISESWKSLADDPETKNLPRMLRLTGFARQDLEVEQPFARLEKGTAIAKSLAFREAYGLTSSVRPDLAVNTYQIRVKENRRLTPVTYDRNIFHIEFDLGDSGLNYAIGESLGVHGLNDLDEVNEFMRDYGLNPEDIVQVPSVSNPSVLETRTVFQSLMQNVDIFGRPPKNFYESLAEFATDPKEKQALLTLTIPDGATQFKRLAEVDTVTFADILLMNPSARPSFPDLVRIIPPMKRREYSIASSQKVQPNTVSLLVVVVNWQDPRGRNRYGQCTRYLSTLPIGATVTASIKPSVMKLPPLDTQPIIMAGLGTGLAPFRAFCQYRAWQKEQGIDIGAVLLYMGSRHQREEYLYGEEWEAWRDAGVITLLGRAFSRDQKQKIYIQDRMRQTIDDIVQAYLKKDGAFYLCGPTWPVPDVTDVLQEAIEMEAKDVGKKVNSKRVIDELKDEGRYVLEVY